MKGGIFKGFIFLVLFAKNWMLCTVLTLLLTYGVGTIFGTPIDVLGSWSQLADVWRVLITASISMLPLGLTLIEMPLTNFQREK